MERLSVPGPATTELLISRSTNNGLSWSPQAPLTAAPTTGNDHEVSVATDGAGTWIAVWSSDDSLGGTVGTDYDILYSVSSNGGANWSNPAALSSNANMDTAPDYSPSVATDSQGNWIVVWVSPGVLPNGTSFSDGDILFARSTANGAHWTPVSDLDPNATTDTAEDAYPTIAASPYGGFIAIWESQDFSGSPYGDDLDLFGARSFDGGATWSSVSPINTNAISDFHYDGSSTIVSDGRDLTWIAVWQSDNDLMGMIGNDVDLLFARLVADCNNNGTGDANELHFGTASDCNNNHTPDECDISSNASNDANGNQVPDECETPCATMAACNDGDVCTCNQCILGFCTSNRVRFGNTNCAGPQDQVNLDDILCSLAAFANPAACPNADIHPACTGNGMINLDDILAALSAFTGLEPCNCLP